MEKVHQEYMEDINASGRHLLSLINDILDFSKAEAGKLQMEWAESDVTKIIRNSLRMVMPRAESAQVTLFEDLPSQHLVIITDAKKLKQVLLNLLSNAVKFTPAGGEVRCHAWVDVVTGGITIEVRDTGIGIAPKDISRVMTPFGQVDSALSRKYEGTGLGLPLSKKFVESMGGTFTIESELKKGTSVTVNIPKAPVGWGTATMNPPLANEATHVASASSTAAA
jgi:two-component system cell cycle sensor histidine kinase PleC